jgi:hypothetical protein
MGAGAGLWGAGLRGAGLRGAGLRGARCRVAEIPFDRIVESFLFGLGSQPT